MSEFASTMRGRVDSARHTVRLARANDDHELADLHEADLRNLERLACEHGVDVGDVLIPVPRPTGPRTEDCPS
ncbi:hypothetical protein [Umezawaea sp. Da 62-37]|uniref:hypothetical protein n=1 Tax=Umezawaea sp. Da 62-37 TaxID=3075927 RepID=UPI0028F703CE|nr:hypothetical protein [Umezawaea sp. Da 62-37]WNV87485.1 hypothetical protein RM788_04050 [Umezawaea sp. Da 62-37]